LSVAITIEGVSKRFRLYQETRRSIKERVLLGGRGAYEEFWALRDVSACVEQGTTVGLLGHNGSGKSTLLKCVAGILRPTSGRIGHAGRVAALLELGAGFHPEMTGRENVFLNAALLGVPRAQTAERFDDIVAFAELEQFIDERVKHYSSGMYVRLGFAAAVHTDPQILLVDEVLAVGDEAFQQKCLEKVRQFQREGRTIVFVTHAADLVAEICDVGIVLDHGRLVEIGDPATAVRTFRRSLFGSHESRDDGQLS
jgi:ABC-2 type transport system ATP-binding protein